MATKSKVKAAGTAVKVSHKLRNWGEPLTSPLAQYPGVVHFPAHWTMANYRAWHKVNEKLKDIQDKDFSGLTMSYSANGDGPRFDLFDPRQWAHVLAVCSFELANMPPEAFTDDSGESTPYEVLGWLIPIVMNEYIPEKLNLKN
jgi:hypothetical protein